MLWLLAAADAAAIIAAIWAADWAEVGLAANWGAIGYAGGTADGNCAAGSAAAAGNDDWLGLIPVCIGIWIVKGCWCLNEYWRAVSAWPEGCCCVCCFWGEPLPATTTAAATEEFEAEVLELITEFEFATKFVLWSGPDCEPAELLLMELVLLLLQMQEGVFDGDGR